MKFATFSLHTSSWCMWAKLTRMNPSSIVPIHSDNFYVGGDGTHSMPSIGYLNLGLYIGAMTSITKTPVKTTLPSYNYCRSTSNYRALSILALKVLQFSSLDFFRRRRLARVRSLPQDWLGLGQDSLLDDVVVAAALGLARAGPTCRRRVGARNAASAPARVDTLLP